ASLGDLRKLGRIGGKTVIAYLATTAIAVMIGLLLSNVIKPGSRIDGATRDRLAEAFAGEAAERVALAADKPSIADMLLSMIPSNPIQAAAQGDLLPLIIFTLLFGAAVSMIAPERRRNVLGFFEGVNDAVMIL